MEWLSVTGLFTESNFKLAAAVISFGAASLALYNSLRAKQTSESAKATAESAKAEIEALNGRIAIERMCVTCASLLGHIRQRHWGLAAREASELHDLVARIPQVFEEKTEHADGQPISIGARLQESCGILEHAAAIEKCDGKKSAVCIATIFACKAALNRQVSNCTALPVKGIKPL